MFAGMITRRNLLLALNHRADTGRCDVPTYERMVALQAENGAPTRVHLLPAGEIITGRDGRSWRQNAQRIIDAFEADVLPLPIDYEHASEEPADGTPRPAAGWIERLEEAADGIWGHVTWTPRGAEVVAAREYRFLSPVFFYDAQTFEILQLISVGLVHRPNLHLTALNARNQTMERTMLKDILAALGLPETGTAGDAVTAINALKADKATALNAAQSPPLDKYVPRTQHDETVTALNAANAKLAGIEKAANEKRAADLIDEAVKAGKITPAAREQYAALALNSFDATKAAIDAMPAILKPGESPELPAKADGPGAGSLTEAQKAICRQIGVSEDDYAKALKAA